MLPLLWISLLYVDIWFLRAQCRQHCLKIGMIFDSIEFLHYITSYASSRKKTVKIGTKFIDGPNVLACKQRR